MVPNQLSGNKSRERRIFKAVFTEFFTYMNVPVPYVFLALPIDKQLWPIIAAC
jgi:hypothetical protein